MREIKFRKWMYSTDEEKYIMIDGDSLAFEEYAPIKDLLSQEGTTQYIGKKDKNGVEIYEEDILKLKSIYLRVYYSENRALYRVEGSNRWHYDINEIMDFNDCEIVGNFFENPELINPIKA